MRALGVDVGEKRIGLAAGDSETRVAVPAGVISNAAGGPQAVADAAVERGVDTIVVGMPLSMNGTRGPQAEAVQGFVEMLRTMTTLNVATWDERLTSVEADRRLREGGAKRAHARTGTRDAAAAAIMLQAFLDARPTPVSEER